MNQDNRFSSPATQGQKLSVRNSNWDSSFTNNLCEHVFVTLIRATDVACSLRRMPTGFHVIVELDGRIIQTSNKPVLTGENAVEWAEEILLPANRSSSILFSVYVSFELGPRQGNGELLRQFKTTVGEVFRHRNEPVQPIDSIGQEGKILPCPSLRIIIEQRICDANEPCHKLDLPEARGMNALEQLTDEGDRALLRYCQREDQMDLDAAIQTFECGQEISPINDPNRSAVLFNLANEKLVECQANNRYLDLDVPIESHRDATQFRSQSRPDHCTTVPEIGPALLSRYQRGAFEFDRDEATDLRAGMVSGAESYANRAGLFGLQMNDGSPSMKAGDTESSPEERPNYDDVIPKVRDALQKLPYWKPRRPALLHCLGMLLSDRFKRNGMLADIQEAIRMFEHAVGLMPHTHPDMQSLLDDLGCALSGRFNHLGDLADINRSISTLEEAVCRTPDGHSDKPRRLNNLGNSLLSRFEHLGDLADLHKSISIQEEAVRLTPDGHPDKRVQLNNLGSSLSHRFEHMGDLADLNRSISMQEEAFCLTPDGHPDKQVLFSILGGTLGSRFVRLEDFVDLNRSISIFEEAVCLSPGGHPSCLSNLGILLRSRFERLGDLADLNRSILMQEEAVYLTPDGHVNMPCWLNNLGNSLLKRFQHLGDLADLNRSISTREEAICLTPNGHPDKPGLLHTLGDSLLCRFLRLGDHADVANSIAMKQVAISFTPDSHLEKLYLFIGLGNAYIIRLRHSHDSFDLTAASYNFSMASRASIGRASARFYAARWRIQCAELRGNTTALLDAYASALDFLPQLAWLGLRVTERHHLLVQTADLIPDSVAAALEAGHPELAVQWLEQGRSIVWTQFLQLRTPVDDLAHAHPALAHEFRQISQELERASNRDNTTFCQPAKISDPDTRSLEKDIQKHHDLALRRENLLLQIRSLPGFDRFLLPKTIKQLATLAISGPVVYLIASDERCDALIVMAELESVIHVPLPGISNGQMEFLRRILRAMLEKHCLVFSRDALYELIPSEDMDLSNKFLDLSLDGNFIGDRAAKLTKPQRSKGYTLNELCQGTLKFLWMYVVNPILQALNFSKPPSGTDKMTRIFWCPTGPFSFFPIHAAGLYDTTEPGTKLSDFVISSYLPTLSSLASSPQNGLDHRFSKLRLLSVPQPATDGLNTLFSVKHEIDSIRELSDRSPFVTLQDSDGTVEDVVEKLRNNDWVHFACHGIQDPEKPLDSGLCLANHRRLKLSDIMKLFRPQGGLAFLSACQTAQGDETLSEESVHLAAGMLLAGYDSVIGTMWSMMDKDGPKVARDVYEHLFRDAGRVPDSTEAAAALHCAIQKLRDSGAPFTSWVPFIHFGR